MKQIYGSGAWQMIPAEGGVIFVAQQHEYDDKAIMVYRIFEPEYDRVSVITRSAYLQAKFGNHFNLFEEKPKEFLVCRTLALPENRYLVVNKFGEAVVIQPDGRINRKTQMLYRGEAPNSFAVDYETNTLWASYTEGNAVIRYTLNNMREDIRIGGSNDFICAPEGLWFVNGILRICSSGQNRIIDLDPEKYSVQEYRTFEEPVHKYIKNGAYETVLLDSGIYKL